MAASAPSTPARADGKPYSTPLRAPRTAAPAQRMPSRLADLFPSPASASPMSSLGTGTPGTWSGSSALSTPEGAAIGLAAQQGSPLALRDRRRAAGAGAQGWQARATEHGIRVVEDGGEDDENYPVPVYDGKRYARAFDPLAALGVSPLGLRRARPAADAAAYVPIAPPPMLPHTPARRVALGALNTPPRHPDADALKYKGALTDPALPRRRAVFPPHDLFDIDEGAHEHPAFAPGHQRVRTADDAFAFDASPVKARARRSLPLEHPQQQQGADADACPVCGNGGGTRVALAPCAHVLCSACFTSALNIVGEKNMECAVCHAGVDNFAMKSAPAPAAAPALAPRVVQHTRVRSEESGSRVLRIDNVPWDVTPPMVKAWLKLPGAVARVHVLLDRKGKTQSHAFVEMRDEDAARAALRTAQNSVLGRGKRARGVTVTRTSEDELLAALFPSWRGAFTSGVPTLRGLSETEQLAALSTGLLDDAELRALHTLVRSPDSHFVKVPSLPFHAVISVLAKLPAAGEHGRTLHTPARRDALFDVAFAAIGALAADARAEPGLLGDLLDAAARCAVFTPEQRRAVRGLADAGAGSRAASSASSAGSAAEMGLQLPLPLGLGASAGLGADSPSTASSELGFAVDEFAPPGLGGLFAPYMGANEYGELVAPIQQHHPLQQKYVAPGPQRQFGTAPPAFGRRQAPELGLKSGAGGRRAVSLSSQARLSALAREFQCDPGLVEAVAARLAAGELM